MKFTLTKELSEKGDKLLKELLNKDSLDNDFVYNLIGEKDEATMLCKYLKSMQLINLIAPTENDEFSFITKESGLSTFLNNGGITRVYLDANEEKKRKDFEFKKTQIDFELAEKMLKEYPYTKWIARVGFFIGILSLILSIIQWRNK